jgi:hypothetical protein
MPNLALWLEGLPNQSLDAGKQLLQELRWNITVQEQEGLFTQVAKSFSRPEKRLRRCCSAWL